MTPRIFKRQELRKKVLARLNPRRSLREKQLSTKEGNHWRGKVTGAGKYGKVLTDDCWAEAKSFSSYHFSGALQENSVSWKGRVRQEGNASPPSLLPFLLGQDIFTSITSLTSLSSPPCSFPQKSVDIYLAFQSFWWLCENKLDVVGLSFFFLLLEVKLPLRRHLLCQVF